MLLVVDIVCWGGSDTEGTKGNEGRRWRGVGPAGRPSLFPFGVSVILKSDGDMTKEEAKERFGDNIINKLLSLGAEPTNVCRNDDIVEWCSDGCIKVVVFPSMKQRIKRSDIRFIETVVFILIMGN